MIDFYGEIFMKKLIVLFVVIVIVLIVGLV